MTERERLLDKLRKVEALCRGAKTPGERVAALAAGTRLKTRLALLQTEQNTRPAHTELRISIHDAWTRQLFLTVCAKHNIKAYRRPRQRPSTVMVNVDRLSFDSLVWPEYVRLRQSLREQLQSVTATMTRELRP